MQERLSLCTCHYCLLTSSGQICSFFQEKNIRLSKQKWLCIGRWNHIYLSSSSLTFRINRNTWLKTLCAGFSGFLVEIKVFWKYWANDTIKKTWIYHTEVSRVSDWMFWDSFDVLKLYLHKLPAKVSCSHFWKKSVCHRGTLEAKNIFFFSRHLQVNNWYTQQSFVVWTANTCPTHPHIGMLGVLYLEGNFLFSQSTVHLGLWICCNAPGTLLGAKWAYCKIPKISVTARKITKSDDTHSHQPQNCMCSINPRCSPFMMQV